MLRYLTAVASLFVMGLAYAEEVPVDQPINVSGIIVFGLVFLGVCIWFGIFVWRNELKRRHQEQAPEQERGGPAGSHA